MANQNQKKKKNNGGMKCPECGTRSLPKDSEGNFKLGCPVCRPEYLISSELTKGKSGWQVIVQTYKNERQENVSFIMQVSGKNLVIVQSDRQIYWKEGVKGVAVIPLKFVSKDRKASFHVIGGPADIHSLAIPKKNPDKFQMTESDKKLGFFENFVKGAGIKSSADSNRPGVDEFSICAISILVGFILSMLLADPLVGMRGAPWINFICWQMPILWSIVILTCTCALSRKASAKAGVGIGDWTRAGGFWKVWSKNNTPGNSWVVITILLVLCAITYGSPTSRVDMNKFEYGMKNHISSVSTKPPLSKMVAGARNSLNYLSKGLVGYEVIASSQSKTAEELKPRYHKGWLRIILTIVCIVITPLVFIWGRRDDTAEKFTLLASRFKSKREANASASTDEGDGISKSAISKLLRRTSIGEHLSLAVAGEFLASGISKLLKIF